MKNVQKSFGSQVYKSHNLVSGFTCEETGCSGYPMVYLNGQRLLCWEHYCRAVQPGELITPENNPC